MPTIPVGDFETLRKDIKPEEQPLVFQLISHPELLELEVPPMMWIMNMMIPNPGLVVVSGKPGSFKTYFVIWMAMQASNGKPLFDEYDEDYFTQKAPKLPMGKVPTLVIEEENSKSLMKERARGFKPDGTTDVFYLIDEGFKFKDPRWIEATQRIIKEKQIKLLVLDPFSSVMGLENENDNAEVSKVMDLIRKEFVKNGLTVILIHHPSKADGDGKSIRGAGDILGKCDVHLSLEVENEVEKLITVSYEKLRVADKAKVSNFKFRLVGDPEMRDLRLKYVQAAKPKFVEERDKVKEQIVQAIRDGHTTKKTIAKALDESETGKKFDSAWTQLKNENIIKQGLDKSWFLGV